MVAADTRAPGRCRAAGRAAQRRAPAVPRARRTARAPAAVAPRRGCPPGAAAGNGDPRTSELMVLIPTPQAQPPSAGV